MAPHFSGLISAPHSPFHEDYSVNLAVVEKLAGCMMGNGLAGVFVNGAMGESMSLAVEERMKLARRWCEVCGKKFPVIVHVGHTSLVEAQAMAAQAQKDGAFGVAAMGPPFFKPATVEDLVEWCRLVAGAAPGLPFYYYHIPILTGVNFAMARFLGLAKEKVPTLAGIKYTHGDLMDYLRCLRFEEGRFDMMFGQDEQLLAALACGAKGAVGSTYGHSASLYQGVMNAFAAGDMEAARRGQFQSTELVALLIKYGPLATNKAIMKLAGIDCGPPRPPLKALTAGQMVELRGDLERIGFFGFCNRVS